MELRRVADVALRGHPSPIAAFLAPSTTSSCLAACRRRTTPFTQPTQRYISSSASLRVSKSFGAATTTSAPSPNTTDEAAKPQNAEEAGEKLSWINSTGLAKRTSRFSLPRAQTENRASSPNALRSSKLDSLKIGSGGRVSGALSSQTAVDITDISKVLSDSLDQSAAISQVPLRLRPTLGRTVMVDNDKNTDVAKAFTLLEQSCAKNRVRADFTKQRFHERPGLKRKRLKSQRWRKRFMEGFKHVIKRVKTLKHQGW